MLSWSDVTDLGTSGLQGYSVQLDDQFTFESPFVDTVVSGSPLAVTLPDAGRYYYWRVKAVDRTGNALPYTPTRMIRLNHPPELRAVGNRQVNAGQRLEFIVSGSDVDGGLLTFGASSLPPGATFDQASRRFSWNVPLELAGATYPGVRFSVCDPGLICDSEDMTITVLAPNSAPVLQPIGTQQAIVGQLLSFTVSASDPESDPLTWKLRYLPDVDGDGFISWADFERIVALFNRRPQTDEERRADLNGDGIINIGDVAFASLSIPEPFRAAPQLFQT